MLRTLAITAIAVLVAFDLSGQPNKASSRRGQETKDAQPAVVHADDRDKQANGRKDQSKSGSSTPAEDVTVEVARWWSKPDWWVLVVASLTCGVVGWQSYETMRAAKGAEEAATATRENTEMQIRQARAHLRVSISASQLATATASPISLRIKLYGPTPAFLLDFRARLYLTENRRPLPFPEEKQDWTLWMPEVMTPEKPDAEARGIFRRFTQEELLRLGHLEFWLHCDGVLRYKDVFGHEHHTKFSQFYSPVMGDVELLYEGTWLKSRSDDANECT